MNDTIFVTGGCGFIGSNFLHMLAKNNYSGKVINIDKLTYAANICNLTGLKLVNYRLHTFDISDNTIVDHIFDLYKPNIVVNFAAESHVDNSIKSSKEFIQTNVVGVQVLLDKSIEYGVKRFCQISTDEVFGDIPLDSLPSKETDILKPSSPYSASKAAAELLVLSYVRTHNLDCVITRSSNNYGPRQHIEKLIPLTIHRLMHNKKVPIYGTGEQIRDWLSVDDNCNGIWTVLNYGKKGEIYNIGANNPVRNIDLVKKIIKIMGKSEDSIEFVADRKGHDFRYAVDSTKLRSLPAMTPTLNFDIALKKTVEWYLDNSKYLYEKAI